jgi:uncharacterized membrane protein
MDKKSAFLTAVSLIAAGAAADNAAAQSQKMEKCFGIVKAGFNDCANATGTHSCATLAKKDKDPAEWLLLPEGICTKIVGGTVPETEEETKDKS